MDPLPDPFTHPVMTVPEVAACLGIHRTTAWRWCQGQPLETFPIGGGVATAAVYALLCRPLPAAPAPPPPPPRIITLTPPEL